MSPKSAFLKDLLNANGFSVIVVPAAPPKAVVSAPKTSADALSEPIVEAPVPPQIYTLGVTNVTFNATNAVFGRLLKTRQGQVVTQAYWNQEVGLIHDEIPY